MSQSKSSKTHVANEYRGAQWQRPTVYSNVNQYRFKCFIMLRSSVDLELWKKYNQ